MVNYFVRSTRKRRLTLASGEIHVWRIWLDTLAPMFEEFMKSLSTDERGRAHRLRFERDRTRFVLGRGILRMILSRYTGVPAEELVFAYGANGKPELSSVSPGEMLRFNVAHSDALALYAVAREYEVGIDVERIHATVDADEIAARFFSERENIWWRGLPEQRRGEAFFNLWTRKEACVKATGDSLAEGALPQSKCIWEFMPANGYAAALATATRRRSPSGFSLGK